MIDLTIPAQLSNFIGGEFLPPVNRLYIGTENPATGEAYLQLPQSDKEDVALAVAAAKEAFPAWSNLPAEKKCRILLKLADLIDAHSDALALAETNDNGKPLWLSTATDIPRASANFRFFATACLQVSSESHAMENKAINYTLRQPIGIVGCISPWNLPLYLFTWKIAPALAAGNCVIAKPSEVTPATAYLLSKLCLEAGLPAGVLNILHGTGAACGEAIVAHPSIKAISFTGSTRAGERIASVAAPMFKKLSLELGGKNPALIFADCDWEQMLDTVVRSSFTNQGQICLCSSRILIEASIYEQFKTAFVERVQQLTVGDPLEDHRQGAMVSKVHFDKVVNSIQQAKAEGGTILCGGSAVPMEGRCKNGYFIQPTVFENLGPDTLSNQEEIFGPVVTLQPFHNEAEAIALANNSSYGLAATIHTSNLPKAHRVAAALECGLVWINCWMLRDLRTSFGGSKNSGVGREGGWEAMRFFTEAKNICIQLET